MTKYLYLLKWYLKYISSTFISLIVVILNVCGYKWISNMFKMIIRKIKIIIKFEFEECLSIIKIANLQLTWLPQKIANQLHTE